MDELNNAVARMMKNDNCDPTETDQLVDRVLENLDNEECDHEVAVKSLLAQDIMSKITALIKKNTNSAKVTQIIAEIAKIEEGRQLCVSEGLVPQLLSFLSKTNIALAIQAGRALGNICFDYDAARNAIAKEDGIDALVKLMQQLLGHSEEGATRLRMVLCGMLLNLTSTHESIQEVAISLGVLEILQGYLTKHSDEECVLQMALPAIGSLSETDTGRSRLCQCDIVTAISQLLSVDRGEELLDTVLDVLSSLAENDEVKVQLARASFGSHILRLLANNNREPEDERQHLEKNLSEVLVMLLTGDESMEILYDKGEGLVFLEAIKWLQSPHEQLQISSALAIGNFARNDEHCHKLMEVGITESLLKLLEAQCHQSEPVLQHAVFSAIRNLSIPSQNKSAILKYRVIERLLPYIETEFSSVQFKLLGTFRMIIDGQEAAARQLGTHEDFIKKLVSWCTVEDHAGVKGEANRLVAWLIKHSRSKEVMRLLHDNGGVQHLVTMSLSEHAVMQNEAVLSLVLVATSIPDVCMATFSEVDLIPTIKVLLTEKNIHCQILQNTLNLTKTVAACENLLVLMQAADFDKVMTELTSHEESAVSKLSTDILTLMNKS